MVRAAAQLHVERQSQRRSTDHNARFHAMCRDFEKCKVMWGGRTWATDDWKRLFLGAKFGQPVVPNPFSHGISVMNAKRSRDLTNGEMEELLNEMQAFGDEQGVAWSSRDDE